jgi:pyruvate formate lyase activating enzyme
MAGEQREAVLWRPAKEGAVTCGVCPRRCRITPGGRGTCEARENVDGKLVTVTYGLCSSIAVDPIEKKPVFHFHPGTLVLSVGTVGCNMRCKHCQNWQISRAHTEDGSELTWLSPEQLVAVAEKEGCQGVAWTYNEPTIWLEYVRDGAKLAREAGLYTVMVTNGYITTEALDEIGPYMDVWRVDVKGFTDETYRYLAGIPHIQPILEGAERAKHHWHMHVEVVTNVIPTVNDDDEQLSGIASWIADKLGPETPWHVTRFIPYLELSHLSPTPVATLEKARRIGMEAGLSYVYIGNVAGNEGENTYCPSCGELLIERVGYQTAGRAMDAGRCRSCGQAIPIVG